MRALRGKSIAVAGQIAGGKSTFVRRADRLLRAVGMDVRCESEHVPAKLLELYCADPKTQARDFQTHMHAHACARDKAAWLHARNYAGHHFSMRTQTIVAAFAITSLVWPVNWQLFAIFALFLLAETLWSEFFSSVGHVALVERTLSENLVFFETNLRSGNLVEAYRPHYAAMCEDYRQYAPDLIIYLHVSNETAVARMNARAQADSRRVCEQKYEVDGYLTMLSEEYFNFVVRHGTSGSPPVLVVNWEADLKDAEHSNAVHQVLQKANAYFQGKYKLPNFTVADRLQLSTSTGNLRFDRNAVLSQLAEGKNVNL